MATSAQHRAWTAKGSPYVLARPAAALQKHLRAHGYTVYDFPDASHLDAQPPEDHTPYSATGWPGTSPFGRGMAIDIMPPLKGQRSALTGEPLMGVAELAARLYSDRQASAPGVAWLKYMNRPLTDGRTVQDRWMPGYSQRASSDRGHIHLSVLTTHVDYYGADDYDPLGVDMQLSDRLDIPNYDRDGSLPEIEHSTAGTALGVASQRSWQAKRNTEIILAKLAEPREVTVSPADLDAALDRALVRLLARLAAPEGS